ncbi:MAG: PQQ-dependent dehydrogenase, methanol/ethanol family [Gammaproteobacteria bacterium]
MRVWIHRIIMPACALRALIAAALLAALSGPSLAADAPKAARPKPGAVDAARMANADGEPHNWMALGRDTLGQNHTPLTGIDANNVGRLGLAWEYRTRTHRGRVEHGMEATPIVVDGVMYASGPWGIVFAVNAKTGAEIWRYEPKVDASLARRSCCDVVNRGVQVWQGRVYVATFDGYLVALDAATGKVAWKRDTIVDRTRPYTITGSPQVAGKNVIIGNSGSDLGIRGYVSAWDVTTGEFRWRFYTVPGDPAKGFEHPELAEAAKTWDPNSEWTTGGGGAVWADFAYDPKLNLVYFGTGNALPYPLWRRSPEGGDSLFTASILALDADTGRLRWHYQTTPGDQWDYDADQPFTLADVDIGGRKRQVLFSACKNGFFYVIDRATGELISAEKFVKVNWAKHVDVGTGRPIFDPAGDYRNGPTMVFPSVFGAHHWMRMSYSPRTGLVYFPAIDMGMVFYAQPGEEYRPGHGNGVDFFSERVMEYYKKIPAPQPKESLLAWDPVKQREAWRVPLPPRNNGGVLSTASDLVFQGTIAGDLIVYRADNGQMLKKIPVGTAIMAAPISYSVDGEQYVAVLAGLGGSVSFTYSADAAPNRYKNYGRLLAFKLDGRPVPLPPAVTGPAPVPAPPDKALSDAVVAQGEGLYAGRCAGCHGTPGAEHRSIYPDLARMPRAVHEGFRKIVYDGVFKDYGMAGFSDVLSLEQVDAIHDYLISVQRRIRAPQK